MVAFYSGPSSRCAGFALVIHGVWLRASLCRFTAGLGRAGVEMDGLRACEGRRRREACEGVLLVVEMRLDAILQLTTLAATAGLLAFALELKLLLFRCCWGRVVPLRLIRLICD